MPSSYADSPEFPERLGRYEVLVPIADGGMGRVFLGRIVGPRGFERDVAIKLLRSSWAQDPTGIDPLDEAKLAARIRHPNVVPVIDVDLAPEGVVLVMDYVEGDSLAAILEASGGSLPVPVALKILADALSGLDAAHELCDSTGRNLGVVHRDFSPQNILVGLDGMARLTDFGIAKAFVREGKTQSGIVKGKVGYMAPEQASGRPLDRRSDAWAAGVVAWELFSGQRLYPSGGDPVATAVQIVTSEPRRLRAAKAELSQRVEDAVHYALAKDIDRRCPSARTFRDCLLQAWDVLPADAAEVAECVRTLTGAKLEDRRFRAEEVARNRRPDKVARVIPPAPAIDASAPATVVVPHLEKAPRGWFKPTLAVAGAVSAAIVLSFSFRRVAGTTPTATASSGSSDHAALAEALPATPTNSSMPARETVPAQRLHSPAAASLSKAPLERPPVASQRVFQGPPTAPKPRELPRKALLPATAKAGASPASPPVARPAASNPYE